MLLANCTVAEHILRAFPSCALLRRHPTPEPKQFEPLLGAAAAVGVDINPDTSKVHWCMCNVKQVVVNVYQCDLHRRWQPAWMRHSGRTTPTSTSCCASWPPAA